MAKCKITYNGQTLLKGAVDSPYRMSTQGRILSTDLLVSPVLEEEIIPTGTIVINSVDTTTTFDVTPYAAVKFSLVDADELEY